MPAEPDRRDQCDPQTIHLYMARAQHMTEATRQAVEHAFERSRAIRARAEAAVQRAEARLKWVRAAKLRLVDRVR